MPIEYWWPTPIYYSTFDESSGFLEDISLEIDEAIKTVNVYNPWPEATIQSSFMYNNPNLFLDNTPKLKEYINKHVKKFVNIDFFISESWINIGGMGARQEKHIHTASYLSGCYYHKTNTTDGDIEFDCNDSLLLRFSNNIKPVVYHPEVGKILLFPSYLSHGVKTNHTTDQRISVAFNVVEVQNEAKWKCR
jgi:uncharacterized protein (TIGR02466 family)